MGLQRVGHNWLTFTSRSCQPVGFPGSSDGKEPACNAKDSGSNPGQEGSPGKGNGNALQYSCLENPHEQRSLAGCSPLGYRVGHKWATKYSTSVTRDIYFKEIVRPYWKLMKMKVTQLCPTVCDPMDYTVHGILQARILEWVAIPFSRGSFWPRNRTGISCTAGDFFNSWATREAPRPYCKGLIQDLRNYPVSLFCSLFKISLPSLFKQSISSQHFPLG